MNKNKHSLLAVFFIISWVALAIFASFFAYLYIQNKGLRASITLLEDKTMNMLEEGKRYQELQKSTNKLEDDVMEFLEWKFVVKEQTAQANQRLLDASVKMKDLKKDKALLNLFYYNLGLSYILSQDFSGAIVAFEKALEYKPKDAWSCYDLGLLYSVIGGNAKKAEHYYNKYLELDPVGVYVNDVKMRLKGLKTEKRKGQ